MDGRRRGGQPPLQRLQGKSDILLALVVVAGKALHAIHFLTHVSGHRRIQRRFRVRQVIGHGVGPALGKQRPAIELEQLLLGQAPHQVAGIRLMHAIAEAPLKAVAIQQGQKQLEICFLAVVGGRGHQQEMPAVAARPFGPGDTAW